MSLGQFTSWLRPSSKNRRQHHHRSRPAHLQYLQPGDDAGVAVYQPRDHRDLKSELRDAIGTAFPLTYVGIAGPHEPFSGQMLFQERRGGTLRSWLAEHRRLKVLLHEIHQLSVALLRARARLLKLKAGRP